MNMKAERIGGSRGQHKWNCRDDNCNSATVCMRMCFQCDEEDTEFYRSKPFSQQPKNKQKAYFHPFNLKKEAHSDLKKGSFG